MSFPNTSRFIPVAICGLLMCAAALRAEAQSADGQPAAVIPFAASIRTGERIGFEQVRRVNITVGTNEFAFVLPRGINLRVDASAPDKITISSADCSYFVTLRLITSAPEGMSENESSAFFKNLVVTQYDGASGVEESTLSADGQTGPAFDANWYVGNMNTRRVVRVGFIPTQAGTLECSVVTDPKKSSEAKAALGSVLMTFRSNRSGKLENIVLADKS